MELTPEWLLPWQSDAATAAITLGLGAVFQSGTELIYLFSNAPSFQPDARPVEDLPPRLREVLLFEPVFPVRLCNDGFRSLHPDEWSKIVMCKERTQSGLQTLSYAPESAGSADLAAHGILLQEDDAPNTSSDECDGDSMQPDNAPLVDHDASETSDVTLDDSSE